MTEYRYSTQAVWHTKDHLVWITKYRCKVLTGEVAERARDLLRQICAAREVQIIRGAVSPDHIHLLRGRHLRGIESQIAPFRLVRGQVLALFLGEYRGGFEVLRPHHHVPLD